MRRVACGEIRVLAFKPAPPADRPTGLMAFVDLEIAGLVRIRGATIRRSRGGWLYVAMPDPVDARGRRRGPIAPVDRAARAAIDAAVLGALARDGRVPVVGGATSDAGEAAAAPPAPEITVVALRPPRPGDSDGGRHCVARAIVRVGGEVVAATCVRLLLGEGGRLVVERVEEHVDEHAEVGSATDPAATRDRNLVAIRKAVVAEWEARAKARRTGRRAEVFDAPIAVEAPDACAARPARWTPRRTTRDVDQRPEGQP